MTSPSGASAFLFRNEKPVLTSKIKAFEITSPITDGIAIINVENKEKFRLVSANESFLKNINSEKKNPLGSLITKIFWGDDIYDDKLQKNLMSAYQNKKALAFIWKLNISNTPQTLLCKIIPLSDVNGEITQINVTTCDYVNSEELDIEVSQYNYFDTLKGLPNKFKFYENLEQEFSKNEFAQDEHISDQAIEAAVLFINIKKLQRVNESYGYEIGDKVLKALAIELQNSMHEKAELARFSNDKFVIFLSENYFDNVKREATNLAQSIHHNIATKSLIYGNDIHVSVSIDIAAGQASKETIEQIMQNAHLAMKRNSDLSSNQTIVFNQEIQAQAERKIRLEKEFRDALENDALELHYQPIINLQNGLINGFEALARWNNSSRGSISPLEFIALAEEVGLIIPLGEWALNEACSQLKKWIDNDPVAHSLFMAVNVSSTHIITGNIAALTRDALAKSGLSGHNLKLELTESTIMENSDIARNILLDLKTHGISLAVDDFGTGYSSLSYLSRIPADSIKIDRSFIQNIDNNDEGVNMVNVILNLAKSLGMTVIAEGIETEQQALKLKELGCHFAQGFLFSRAIKADQIPEMIKNQPYKKLLS
ncbi:bifunctional diguanylate cyclase/phosphodiesterase [Emcibacteraceae bacterium]|nr:bifunctional diguanylate cyclase/phosphodiesterase [Emcibacteraceae bacterium]